MIPQTKIQENVTKKLTRYFFSGIRAKKPFATFATFKTLRDLRDFQNFGRVVSKVQNRLENKEAGHKMLPMSSSESSASSSDIELLRAPTILVCFRFRKKKSITDTKIFPENTHTPQNPNPAPHSNHLSHTHTHTHTHIKISPHRKSNLDHFCAHGLNQRTCGPKPSRNFKMQEARICLHLRHSKLVLYFPTNFVA